MNLPPVTSKQERLIQQVLRYFDFDKVEKVMEFLDWKWLLPNITGLGRPTRFQMEQACYRHLCNSIQFGGSGAGGFFARYYVEEDGFERFSLEFSVTGWDVDTDGLEDHEQGHPRDLWRNEACD